MWSSKLKFDIDFDVELLRQRFIQKICYVKFQVKVWCRFLCWTLKPKIIKFAIWSSTLKFDVDFDVELLR